jgi:ABC-type sugar transport system permease subunit
MTALALDKKGKGYLPRGLMRSLWFLPALLSGTVVGMLWRIMYNYNNGVINKMLVSAGLEPVNWLETRGITNIAVIVGSTWVQIGFCVIVFLAGLQSIDQNLYEAAELDGASPRQKLWNITMPMMASSITINVITTTIAGFKAYELPYNISQGMPGKSTLLMTQRIYFFGFQDYDYGLGSALSVFLLLIIAAISLIQLIYLKKKEDIY